MSQSKLSTGRDNAQLEIIAFRLQGQEFCVETMTVREIRGWTSSTPIPGSPHEMLGVMNLRGSVIPIIDLACKLGMGSTKTTERSAIVVAEIDTFVVGLLVDQVSDILTINGSQIQTLPELASSAEGNFSNGMITQDTSMICFLNLSRIFADSEANAA